MNKILLGDCLKKLKKLPDNSVDLLCTDPPYGYSFMGKDWDRAVPSVEVWRECLRVLKPGAFAFIMSAPRSDVMCAMIECLQEAGFRLDFTPIYWTYASGFPKAGDAMKCAMKKFGDRGRKVGTRAVDIGMQGGSMHAGRVHNVVEQEVREATNPKALGLKGAKLGFQPKPAVEVVIVAMKPLSEKTFVDQALKNGKGITWLDDCRIPTNGEVLDVGGRANTVADGYGYKVRGGEIKPSLARFPANLLVSDDVLNDGRIQKSGTAVKRRFAGMNFGGGKKPSTDDLGYGDTGSYSRYFDLDAWAQTFPFLIVAKAGKAEKNAGLENLDSKNDTRKGNGLNRVCEHCGAPQLKPKLCECAEKSWVLPKEKNHHPTVKPLKLMSYLITLGSRPNDVVLDPFLGSGTTAIAAKALDRCYIGIERDGEYVAIARRRLRAA